MKRPMALGVAIVALTSCAAMSPLDEELRVVSFPVPRANVSYFELVFPKQREQTLGMQLALVKKKSMAADIERLLLRHDVSYHWLVVSLNQEVHHLLVAGPYPDTLSLVQHRTRLRGILKIQHDMPALAYVERPELDQAQVRH